MSPRSRKWSGEWDSVLQCVAVCCSVLQRVLSEIVCCIVLQRVFSEIVCCSVLQRVLSQIVCCSVLQRVLPHSQHTPQRTIFDSPSWIRLPSLFSSSSFWFPKSFSSRSSASCCFFFSFFLFSVDYFFQIGHVCGLYRKKKQISTFRLNIK